MSPEVSPENEDEEYVEEVSLYDTTEDYSRDFDRVDLIRQLQLVIHKDAPGLNLNLMQFAFLLQLNHNWLKDMAKVTALKDTLECLKSVEPFLKFCLGRSGYLDKKPGDDEEVKDVDRDQEEREKALQRDRNTCVFTQVGDCDGACIIPQTITKSQRHAANARRALGDLLRMRHADLWKEVEPLLFGKDGEEYDRGRSDMSFNFLTLGTQVHRFFDRCVFGLKPIRLYHFWDEPHEEKKQICVEWRYLPVQLPAALENEGVHHLRQRPTQVRPVALCEVNVESEGLSAFLEYHLQHPMGDSENPGDDLPLHPSGRRLESGMRFCFPASEEEAKKMPQLLRLSWLALRVASLCSAAEAIDYLRDEPPADWEAAYQAACRRYLAEQAALEAEEAANQAANDDLSDDELSWDDRQSGRVHLRDTPDPQWLAIARALRREGRADMDAFIAAGRALENKNETR